MQGFNHIAGGAAFTGIFASFANVNIFEKPEYIAATALFSLAADIDHTRSLIGKAVYPLASWINTKFGHRTITHSAIFYIGLLVVIATLESYFNFSHAYFIIAAFAYGSHLIFDMCTKQGIPLFWPFSRRPAVLPGNPNLRLAVNDLRSEAIVFLVFCSLIFFCMPLMANGFWVSYRKYFLTTDNLKKEYLQSEDYLVINYQIDGNNSASTLLDFQSNKYVLLTNDQLEIVPFDRIKLVDFTHTNKQRKTEMISIFQSTPDSVKSLIAGKIVRSGQIQSNLKIQYFENSIVKESNTVALEWKQNFDFYLSDTTRKNTARITQLVAERRERLQNYKAAIESQQKVRHELEALNSANFVSDYEEGKRITKRRELERQIDGFQLISLPVLTTLDYEIAELSRVERKYVSANLIIQIL